MSPTLRLFQDADHSFHAPARIGRKDGAVHAESGATPSDVRAQAQEPD
jgi:hypothetical protein